MCVCALLLGLSACRRQDIRTYRIDVPDMSDQRAARIVRNALELELRRSDNSVSVDRKTGKITVTRVSQAVLQGAGPDRRKREIGRRIEEELKAVGIKASIHSVQYVPHCPVCGGSVMLIGPRDGHYWCSGTKKDSPCPRRFPEKQVYASRDGWANVYRAEVLAPSLRDESSRNVAVAAIWHALRGKDDPKITINMQERAVTVLRYDTLRRSGKNLEQAVANAGFRANTVPAKLNGRQGLAHGW